MYISKRFKLLLSTKKERSDNMNIKELRNKIGLSQIDFAKRYDIPIRTLQRWEKGESQPIQCILKLIEKDIGNIIIEIEGNNKEQKTKYYYNSEKNLVSDKNGNYLSLNIDLNATSMHNLGLYLDTLFEKYYKARKIFEEELIGDKKSEEKIEWERMY